MPEARPTCGSRGVELAHDCNGGSARERWDREVPNEEGERTKGVNRCRMPGRRVKGELRPRSPALDSPDR
jgi:hypothetical protein